MRPRYSSSISSRRVSPDMTGISVPAPVLFLRDRFGGDFEETDGVVDVDAAAILIARNDPECVALTIINTGTDDVYLAPNNKVSTAAGIELNPGGSLSLTVRDDATLPTREWWAIGASAGQTVYFLRVRRYVTIQLAGAPGG